ncbi:hypothetical protein [Nostoc sp.]
MLVILNTFTNKVDIVFIKRTLEVLGLAWDVKVPTLGMIEAKKTAN